jgi:spectinomycin phosphotransferase
VGHDAKGCVVGRPGGDNRPVEGEVLDWLRRALADSYGLDVDRFGRPGGGKDPVARSYVASAADGRRFLVKVRPASAPRELAAEATAALQRAGLPYVVAPEATRSGTVTAVVGAASITVTPFVDALPAWGRAGLSAAQWTGLGAFARRLHAVELAADLLARLPVERYRPPELELVAAVDAAAAALPSDAGPAADVAASWRTHRALILGIAQRTNELGEVVRARSLPLVVCHADLHTGNVLVDDAGGMWVVDWDELVRAPRERDLMFVIGGISEALVRPEDTARFLDGYGEVDVDPIALAYYRCAWAIQDVTGYAHQVLVERDRTSEERVEAAAIFLGLFRPGEIVDLAGRGDP